MVQFIKQEASEKANEINVAAEEEFNIEKLQLVESEKRKIRQEYERKEKQIEVAKKIDNSKQLNASRLKVLAAQNDIVAAMREATEKELLKVSQNEGQYQALLHDLILQCLLRLKEGRVQLRCRVLDLDLVTAVLPRAKAAYKSKIGSDVEVEIGSTYLPPPPGNGVTGATCAGGVALATKDGKIVVSNTLDARLDIAFKQLLPQIRKGMFKTSIVT